MRVYPAQHSLCYIYFRARAAFASPSLFNLHLKTLVLLSHTAVTPEKKKAEIWQNLVLWFVKTVAYNSLKPFFSWKLPEVIEVRVEE